MFGKLAVAAMLVVGQTPVMPVVQPANVDDARILDCEGRRGTVWRISGDRYVTADHVNIDRTCMMDNKPIRVIQRSTAADFALLSTSRGEGRVYEIDCRGYVAGQTYRAIGYAGGRDLLAMPVTASGERFGQPGPFATLHRLHGHAFPGMSGGPVISREGKVVGIVNAGNMFGLFLSRPLSETSICNGGA